MEDGAAAAASSSSSFSTFESFYRNSTEEFDLMDELLYEGYLIEIPQPSESDFPSSSTTTTVINNLPSYFLPQTAADNNYLINPNTGQKQENNPEEPRKSSQLGVAKMDQFPANRFPDQVFEPTPSSLGGTEAFPAVQTDKTSRILWAIPPAGPSPVSSVMNRLTQAIEYLRESMKNRDALIQIWVPVRSGGVQVLTTKNQPFSFNPNFKSLADYRDVSRSFQFAAEENSKELLGLPSRVFLKKLPEWTPDVRFFKVEEYPRLNHARQYNVGGSLALPVFERGTGTCLGVVELVTTSQQADYCPEIENVCRALEAVDLRSPKILGPPRVKAWHEPYDAVLMEIRQVLRVVCETHGLPLAHAWAPCIQQGKGGSKHSDENYTYCVSTVDSACYVQNPKFSSFHKACSEQHLFKGKGIAGRAFTTNQPCFSKDITAFNEIEYPLARWAAMCGLRAAVAIRLRGIHTGSADFVLEFFLPLDCTDKEEQKQMLAALSSVIVNVCQTLRAVTNQELAEEGSTANQVEESQRPWKLEPSSSTTTTTTTTTTTITSSSWIADMIETQRKGKGVSISLGNQKEEPKEEFKFTTQWDTDSTDNSLHCLRSFTQQQQNNQIHRVGADGGNEFPLDFSKSVEKRRKKAEKTISLQVLRQYFAGSLKDAAKNIGVCPTTLKRICRQHGITRWPSRKIKKVGHSLRKLQLVIDSVHPGGQIQLGSFYDNFPELGSQDVPPKADHLSSHQQVNPPDPTMSKSPPSSSCSQSSTSSFSCSAETKQQSTPTANNTSTSVGLLKRARSDAELINATGGGDEMETSKFLLRCQSQKVLSGLPSCQGGTTTTKPTKTTFKVKASFREMKIRFSMHENWGFMDLQREIMSRFNLEDVSVKYLDDDSEWVLLTCDEDLEECVDIQKCSKNRTIKLLVQEGFNSNNNGSLFGGISSL